MFLYVYVYTNIFLLQCCFSENTISLIKIVAHTCKYKLQIFFNVSTGSIVKISSSTDRIKKYVPLKSLEEIKQLETLLLQETFINEYKTFIQKVGGHAPRENIRNALSRIFSNKCSMKYSWKDRRQNFGVYKLRLIVFMKDTYTYYTTMEISTCNANRKRI